MSTPLRPELVRGVPLSTWTGEPGHEQTRVTGVSLDSRTTLPGDLYVALPGSTTHGSRFAAAAAERGAVVILTDAAGAADCRATGLPVLVRDNPRHDMALLAAEVYDHPGKRLLLLGVTGTNGKTTTVFMLEAALRAAGRRVGTIGTVGFRLFGAPLESSRTTITTPESPDLQALLAVMVERGADTVVMEVSSHALALDRVLGLHFEATGFTNLGWDHRDFHPTQEDYFEAKAKLFTPAATEAAVVCVDEEWGRRLADRVRNGSRDVFLATTGLGEDADYRLLRSW